MTGVELTVFYSVLGSLGTLALVLLGVYFKWVKPQVKGVAQSAIWRHQMSEDTRENKEDIKAFKDFMDQYKGKHDRMDIRVQALEKAIDKFQSAQDDTFKVISQIQKDVATLAERSRHEK